MEDAKQDDGSCSGRRKSWEPSSRIPVRSPATTPTLPRRLSPFSRHYNNSQSLLSLDGDDVESLGGRSSVASCDCEHPHFPANGTTYSGRSKRYVVHCSPTHSCSPEQYLTPTQRANRTIRQLRAELAASQAELSEREREIARLTRQIVQLGLRRLEEDDDRVSRQLWSSPTTVFPSDIPDGRGRLATPTDRSPRRPSDTSEPRRLDNLTEYSPNEEPGPSGRQSSDHSPDVPGGRELRDYSPEVRLPLRTDLVRPNGCGRDLSPSLPPARGEASSRSHDIRDDPTVFRLCPPDDPTPQGWSCSSETAVSLADSGHFEELSPRYSPGTSTLEREIESLKLEHQAQVKQMKDTTDLQIEDLQLKIREANQRCEELKPELEVARRRLRELEREKEELTAKWKEEEARHTRDYLAMYNKGQQAAIIQGDPCTSDGPPSDIPSLLQQLEVTRQELENVQTMYRRCLESKKSDAREDAEITLKFLKSAIFYFLTDRENSAGHLAAIMSILGFNEEERTAIDKMSYTWK